MKSKKVLLGILALTLVFAMTAVGCDNAPPDNNDDNPQTAIFQGIAAGYRYILTITENKSRAAYTPVKDDSYALRITKTGENDKVSTGTVSDVGTDGTLTLQPKTANSPTFRIKRSGQSITEAPDPITLDDGTTVTAGTFDEGGDSDNVFTSIDAMATWLAGKPANIAATAYNVKLNVADLDNVVGTSGNIKKVLNDNNTKFVKLDLSDSTFTNIDYEGTYEITNLTSVIIPNSLTSVENVNIFPRCTSLTAINADAGNNTFSSQDGVLYNKNKTELIRYPAGKTGSTFTIPDGVTSIKMNTFLDCVNLTSINIPASISNIGIQAFAYCTSLTSITIPATVTSIGDYVFTGSTNLTSVKFEGTITSANFSSNAFYELGDLRTKYLATGGGIGTYTTTAPVSNSSVWTKQVGGDSDNVFTSIDAMATWLAGKPANTAANAYNVKLNVNALNNVVGTSGPIHQVLRDNNTKFVKLDLSGSTFTVIGESVGYFEGCTSLVGITISNGVITIEANVFGGCTNLANITIPASVTSIGHAFYNCTSLAVINIDSGNTAYSSDDGVLYNKDKTTLIQYPAGKAGAFTIPASVTSIGQAAFESCTNLTSVTIPSTVTSIGFYAFYNCTSLTSVIFQGTITAANIDNSALGYNNDLRAKYLAGGIGTYQRSSGSGTYQDPYVWTKS